MKAENLPNSVLSKFLIKKITHKVVGIVTNIEQILSLD